MPYLLTSLEKVSRSQFCPHNGARWGADAAAPVTTQLGPPQGNPRAGTGRCPVALGPAVSSPSDRTQAARGRPSPCCTLALCKWNRKPSSGTPDDGLFRTAMLQRSNVSRSRRCTSVLRRSHSLVSCALPANLWQPFSPASLWRPFSPTTSGSSVA